MVFVNWLIALIRSVLPTVYSVVKILLPYRETAIFSIELKHIGHRVGTESTQKRCFLVPRRFSLDQC